MPIVYKYRPGRGPITKDQNGDDVEIFERDLMSLSENRIYVPTYKNLNDPTEGLFDDMALLSGLGIFKKLAENSAAKVEQAYAKIKEQFKTVGIYSLSKNATSELMWSYYANGHNGYAIEIDTDVLYKSLNGGTEFANIHAFDVKYACSLPQIDISIFNINDGNELFQRFVGYKSKSWKHEEEYRLIFDKGDELKHIDYRAIKGFVFGYLMPHKDIEYVMELFKGRHLSYKKIKLNPKNYKFYTEEIEDLYKDAIRYQPNNVSYDLDRLIEESSFYDKTVLLYKKEAKEAIKIVSCEPFVENIYLLSVSKDKNNSDQIEITVWADYRNPSVSQPKKSYKFVVEKDGIITRVE